MDPNPEDADVPGNWETQAKTAPILSRKFTMEEVDRALLVLAASGGNSVRAVAALNQQGIDIKPRTLRMWRESQYAERYVELANAHGREIEEVAVAGMRETMLQSLQVQQEGLSEALRQVQAGDAKDPSSVARNAAVIAGINAQHLLTYTGRPNVITQHESAEDILKRLAQKHPGMFIEGTAEEIPTAEARDGSPAEGVAVVAAARTHPSKRVRPST